MLAVIISGRPVLTESTTISPTQLAFNFPASPSFSHIVVFLLPGAQLPQGQSAAVYLQLKPNEEFKLLGALSNTKPSAIFKIADTALPASSATTSGTGGDEDAMTDDAAGAPSSSDDMVTLGISLEPDEQVAASLANKTKKPVQTTLTLWTKPATNSSTSTTGTPSTKVLAKRIIANAYNFLASFSGTAGPGGIEVVPLKSFQDWWTKFERRIDVDPGFLERPVD